MRQSSVNLFESSENPNLKSMGGEHVESADYSNGIPVARVKKTDRVIRLDVNNTTKIGLFGPSGSGKTVFGKAIASRLYETGRVIFNGGDIKNDFQSLDYEGGVSKDLQDKMGLLEKEQPRAIPKKLYMPKFLTEHYDTIPSYVEPFTFGFQDLSEDDLQFVLAGGNLTGKPAKLLNRVLNDVDLDTATFDELLEKVDETDANYGTKQSVMEEIKSAKADQLVGNRFREDPLKHLNDKTCISLGLEGWRNYSRGSMYKLELYSSVLLDQLKDRASNGDIDVRLVALWPEFHKMCSAGQESLLKAVVEDWFNLAGRQMDMPAIIDSQAPSQIPNPDVNGPYNFLGKLSMAFLGCDRNGRPLGESEWKRVLRSMNMLTRSNKKLWRRKIKSLDRFDFLFVHPGLHDGPRDCPVVRSLAPLCSHPG